MSRTDSLVSWLKAFGVAIATVSASIITITVIAIGVAYFLDWLGARGTIIFGMVTIYMVVTTLLAVRLKKDFF